MQRLPFKLAFLLLLLVSTIGCAQLKCKATLGVMPGLVGSAAREIQETRSLAATSTTLWEGSAKNGFWLHPGIKCSFVGFLSRISKSDD